MAGEPLVYRGEEGDGSRPPLRRILCASLPMSAGDPVPECQDEVTASQGQAQHGRFSPTSIDFVAMNTALCESVSPLAEPRCIGVVVDAKR